MGWSHVTYVYINTGEKRDEQGGTRQNKGTHTHTHRGSDLYA